MLRSLVNLSVKPWISELPPETITLEKRLYKKQKLTVRLNSSLFGVVNPHYFSRKRKQLLTRVSLFVYTMITRVLYSKRFSR